MVDADDPVKARLLQLEMLLKALQTRVEALERQLAPRAEHPSDEVAVRQKVSYDWQS
ncbi:MAG: hypothetical protein ACYDFT_06275 [Thermoplasmata archaeon]